jgi:hypothetical protein
MLYTLTRFDEHGAVLDVLPLAAGHDVEALLLAYKIADKWADCELVRGGKIILHRRFPEGV